MEIDSLVISLGLDPAKLREGLEQVQAAILEVQARLADFARGIQEGMQGSLQDVAEGGAQAETVVTAAGEAAAEAGTKFQDAGKRGAQGMEELGNKSQQAAAKARAAGSGVQTLGRRIGGFLQGIISTVAAPLAGALSAGAIMGSYFSGVAQVAQMTGRYTTQMEEWRKKRELLSRVTREDVELYRKGKLALLDFSFAMAGLSTTIMRALSPAIRAGIDLLHSLADWVRRNEPNIIRFFTVLAGTITAVLIPSFYKLARAMLLNPLTWIIAGILLLAIVIDDLVTYIRGGESAFEGLWSQFGSGEEILAWLTSAARSFLGVMQQYGPALAMVTGALTAVRVAMKLLGVAALSNPVLAILSAIAMAAVYIIGNWSKISAFFKGVFDKVSGALQSFIQKAKDMLPDWLKKMLGIDGAASLELPGGHGEEGGTEQPQKLPTGIMDPLGLGTLYIPPSAEELTRASVPASATVNNTRNQNIDARYTTNIYAPGADPQAMAGAFDNQMRQQNAQLGALAAEGGVRQ